MDKKEKLFMAALGWLHDGLLFGCLFLIPAAVPGQGRTAGILTGSGLLLGLMSAVSWLCVRKLRSGVLYGAAAALFSGAAALLAFFLGSGYGIVWQTALPAAVLLFSLMLFGMRATDKIRKNRAARELREMPGVIPDGQKGGLAEILDEPAPPHLLLFGAVYLWAVTQDASEVWNRVFILLLADLFVCLIWGYLDRMENFIQTHRHVARLPVRAMKRTGLGILGFLAVCLALLVLPAALYGKEPLADIELPKSEFTIQMETEEMEMPVGNDPISMQELLGEGARVRKCPAGLRTPSPFWPLESAPPPRFWCCGSCTGHARTPCAPSGKRGGRRLVFWERNRRKRKAFGRGEAENGRSRKARTGRSAAYTARKSAAA